MANRWFKQFPSTLVPKVCTIYGGMVFGTSGAVSSISGNGVYGITKLATGVYVIQTNDTFNSFLHANFNLHAGFGSNANVNDGSLVATTLYQITAVGTTNWQTVGLDAGLTAAVGQNFVATTSSGSGNGTAKAITPTTIAGIEVIRSESTMLSVNSPAAFPGKGSLVTFQMLNYSDALASPVTGSSLTFQLTFNNSYLTA